MAVTSKVAETLCVAEFSKLPGPRYRNEGDFSAEDFREHWLLPAFQKAVTSKRRLRVDLDGGYGYATSFLEEAFGGLARRQEYSPEIVLDILEFKSDEEPYLIGDIQRYIRESTNGPGPA